MKLLQRLKNLFLPEGKISDGFHSFDELVNRGEIITQGIRSISENLSLIMEGEPESFRGGDIAFSTARRVMEMLGWKCSYAGKATLGQDAYYCIICTKPDKDFKYKIFGNAYEGSISISKEKL